MGKLQHPSPVWVLKCDLHHHVCVAWFAHEKSPCGPLCLKHAVSHSPSLPANSIFISVEKKARRFWTTLKDGVNYYSLQHYSLLDSVQGNLLSYHVCETRPVSRIMVEPIRQRQTHSIEIKPRWKSCSWETSPERLSDTGNYASANTPADLQLLYHLIRALWKQKALVAGCDEMSWVAWHDCVVDYSDCHCQEKGNQTQSVDLHLRASGGSAVPLIPEWSSKTEHGTGNQQLMANQLYSSWPHCFQSSSTAASVESKHCGKHFFLEVSLSHKETLYLQNHTS